MSKEFKAGDKVYYPKESNKVFTIEDDEPTIPCPLRYPLRCSTDAFTRDGRRYVEDTLPSLFHATPENHALLEQLYGTSFETPPVKPTSLEIIHAMHERGDESVCCWVSQSDEYPTRSSHWAFVITTFEDVFIDGCGEAWRFATPFNPQTGQPITELPNE